MRTSIIISLVFVLDVDSTNMAKYQSLVSKEHKNENAANQKYKQWKAECHNRRDTQ